MRTTARTRRRAYVAVALVVVLGVLGLGWYLSGGRLASVAEAPPPPPVAANGPSKEDLQNQIKALKEQNEAAAKKIDALTKQPEVPPAAPPVSPTPVVAPTPPEDPGKVKAQLKAEIAKANDDAEIAKLRAELAAAQAAAANPQTAPSSAPQSTHPVSLAPASASAPPPATAHAPQQDQAAVGELSDAQIAAKFFRTMGPPPGGGQYAGFQQTKSADSFNCPNGGAAQKVSEKKADGQIYVVWKCPHQRR